MKTACREFERRVGETVTPKGGKTERVHEAVRSFQGEFTLGDLERACPEVSRDMVRRVLRELKAASEVECLGKGPGARWRKRGGSTLK